MTPMIEAVVQTSDNTFTFRRILSVFSFMSGLTVLCLFFTVLTNKYLALVMGVHGVALMGVYRTLGGFTAGLCSSGYSTLFMQRISVTSTEEKRSDVYHGAIFLIFIQGITLLLVGIFFAKFIASWVLETHNPSALQIRDTRVVLLMAWVNICFAFIVAVLRGLGDLKRYSQIHLLTSLASLLLIFPLLKLGTLGLAINVASGGLIAVLISACLFFQHRRVGPLSTVFGRGLAYVRHSASPSAILTWQTIATTGAILVAQSLIAKSHGMDVLGNFNAAYLIIETGVLILMASVRSFFLPRFGQFASLKEKVQLLESMISALLFFSCLGIAAISAASEGLIYLLFSSQFNTAGPMLVIFSMSLIGTVFCWSYNTFLLHMGQHSIFTLIDTLWAFAFTLMLYGFPSVTPLTIAWIYVATGGLSALLYISFTVSKFGREVFPSHTLKKGFLCLCLAIVWVARTHVSGWESWVPWGLSLLLLYGLFRRDLKAT